MDFVLTFVAATGPLQAVLLARIAGYLDSQGLAQAGDPRWLRPHKAADLYLPQRPGPAQMRAIRGFLEQDRVDVFIQASATRKKKLLLSDMDSTIIANETLDDLAEAIGRGEACRAITEKTMRGEMDLAAAIRERVTMLKGMPIRVLEEALADVTYSPGAELLVRGMAQQGATCVLVSSGFTFFTAGVARETGFHHHHGNVLGVKDGFLDGTVKDPILDKYSKAEYLTEYLDREGLAAAESMAIGDGSNDLLMLQGAGLGVGYRPKPVLAESLDNLLLYGGLDSVLYAQGLVPNLH